MIAKRIAARTGGRGFGGLARYVVDAQGRADPATWSRTADYILDAAHDGAKVSGVRVTNCLSDDPAVASMEVLATQDKNTRSKREKDYHLVISFPPGERPNEAALRDIEDRLVAAIGMADHQRLSAVHNDTEHLHIHVAINKVHPRTFRNIEPYFDKQRLMETCERLELRFGLQRTNHGIVDDQSQSLNTSKENDHERHHDQQPTDPRVIAALRESYLEAVAQAPEAQSLNGVRNLSSVGVVRHAGGGEVLLSGDEAHHVERGGTQRDDALRREVHGRSGKGVPRSERVTGTAADMEAHSGRESFIRWVRETARPALTAAIERGSWQDVHKAAASYGMTVRPRGAGLVLVNLDGGHAVKASDIDRKLAMKTMTAALGAFEPPKGARQATPVARYVAAPLHAHAGTETLYAAFQRSREHATTERAKARDKQRADAKDYLGKLTSWYREKSAHLKKRTDLNRTEKRAAWASLHAERAADLTAHRAQQAEQREKQHKQYPLPTWQDFLVRAADGGDAEALAVLRSREAKQDRFRQQLIGADDPEKARQIVFRHAKPSTMKNGHILYQTEDGGRVVDRKNDVRVDARTEAAMVLALSLAKDRFVGQALNIEGGAEFKTAVVQAAVTHRIDVRFADETMEKQRQSASTARSMKTDHTRSALQTFVNERNTIRAKVSDVSYHREWSGKDAGAVQYQGRRRLADGTEAVLLQHGDTTLVKTVTSAQAAKASKWKRGTAVTLDERGRFVESRNERKGSKR